MRRERETQQWDIWIIKAPLRFIWIGIFLSLSALHTHTQQTGFELYHAEALPLTVMHEIDVLRTPITVCPDILIV